MTPRAIVGLIQSVCSAVITPSRPNGVLNQGTPAYGYWPWGVALTSMRRSAAERRTHSLNRSLEAAARAGHRRGRLAELARGPALLAVEAAVLKAQFAPGRARFEPRAAPLAARAAH